jgi:riboflavin kinase/FMN adenylyltransferase
VKLLRDLSGLPEAVRHGAVAIGNFDGVHLGHARIIQRLAARARELGGPAVVFTFDPPPVKLLRPDRAPAALTWTERKADLLAELGADAVIAYPTDAALLQLSPREFFDRIIRRQLDARAMVEGPNFFFGHDRQGDVRLLGEFCREAQIPLAVVDPVVIDEQPVSSSRVRVLVGRGAVDDARRMLTRPYRIRGTVVHGAGRGRDLGFPTANLERIDTLLPAEGIYAGRAYIDGRSWSAAISLGPNPTFDDGRLKAEAHLLDFRGTLYDRTIEIDFLSRLRDVQRFRSVEELVSQMDRDLEAARRIASPPVVHNECEPSES